MAGLQSENQTVLSGSLTVLYCIVKKHMLKNLPERVVGDVIFPGDLDSAFTHRVNAEH
jgi:hypothetical protein